MPAATEAAPEVRSSKPVQTPTPKRERAEAQATKEYWLGTLDDCPRANFALNACGEAIEFVRYSGHFNVNENGQVEGNPARGSRRNLTAAQVEALKKDVCNFVVRKSEKAKDGKPWESEIVGDVLDVRGADPKLAPHDEKGNPILTYRAPPSASRQDEEMGWYLYLYPVEPGIALPDRPEPMIARS